MIALTLENQFRGSASSLLDWMQDPSTTDILINGTQSLFVEVNGRLESRPTPFIDTASLMHFIERILIPIGRRVDATRPYLDGVLSDGSRFHLVLPPLTRFGPVLSIRKKRSHLAAPLSSFGGVETVSWLRAFYQERKNLLVVGGTGSGKTTLLSRLLEEVDAQERLVVIEETPEIVVDHPHCVFMEARAATPDGVGEVTLRALIRNALRMRPDRLILGECRGDEAMDLIQALNTGHHGSISTLHANAPLDGLRRLETLVMMQAPSLPLIAVREWIARAIHGVVYLERTENARTIRAAVEIQGVEGDRYRFTPVRIG